MQVLEHKTIEHPNGMIHHSLKYRTPKNSLRLVALIERPYREGKQASLIKANYDYFDKRWIADEVRFFYDQSLSIGTDVLEFDEIFKDAIKMGRLEYIACLKEIDVEQACLDEIEDTPVTLYDYHRGNEFIMRNKTPQTFNSSKTLQGFDLKGYDVYSGFQKIPEDEAYMLDASKNDIALFHKHNIRSYDGSAYYGNEYVGPQIGEPDIIFDGKVYFVDKDNSQ